MSNQQETLSIQQALDRRAQHYDAGRLAGAEEIYQQLLNSYPDQHHAWFHRPTSR